MIKRFSNKVLSFILIYWFWRKLMRKGVGITTLSSETASCTRTKVERDEGNSQRRNKCVVGQADERRLKEGKGQGQPSEARTGFYTFVG